MSDAAQHILILRCPDSVGIVALLARIMEKNDFFIASSRTFGDTETGKFFARLVFENNGSGDLDSLLADMDEAGKELNAFWQVHSAEKRVKTLILVSKSDHCANTLLYGARRGELPIDPVGIVSNHNDLEGPLSHFGVPYTCIPVSKETKRDAEQALMRKIKETGAELIVLARYMQILSDESSAELYGKCINIHHSFLPSFKGARPYHQAHKRGVKVIGATAHYVTPDLDEGPIITQVTDPIDHTHSPADMIRLGRHLEGTALLRAVTAHAEHRVFINDQKTVLFAR